MKTQILLVEDEQDTADLVKTLLEREGFSVLHASDGRQATTLIETMRAPSLILLDMVIPYANGFEVLSAIRHHPDWKIVPVLMFSADYFEPDIKRALREGATTYLVKQPGLYDLLPTIRRLVPAPAVAPASTTPLSAKVAPKSSADVPRKRRAAARAQPRRRQVKSPAA